MFFHFSEMLDVKHSISTGDEVEFTVSNDPAQPQRQLAVRIKHLAAGTVAFDVVIHRAMRGTVEQVPAVRAWQQQKQTAAATGGQVRERVEVGRSALIIINGRSQ